MRYHLWDSGLTLPLMGGRYITQALPLMGCSVRKDIAERYQLWDRWQRLNVATYGIFSVGLNVATYGI